MKKLFLLIIVAKINIILSQREKKIYYSCFIAPEHNILHSRSEIGFESLSSNIGFSSGFNFNIYFNQNQSFKSGLAFGYKNYSHLHQGVLFGTDINPGGITSTSEIKTTISNVEIQLPLIYQLEIKENKYFFTGGIEMSHPLYFKANREYFFGNGDYESQKINKNKTPILLNLQTSFGFRFKIAQTHHLAIEPIIKYYLNDLIIINSKIINFGLKTSYNF